MVARKFLVRHNDSDFDIDYDTDDGFEVLKFQLFSLTSIPPDEQKIFGGDDDRLVSDDSDLLSISDRLRLLSVSDEEGKSVDQNAELAKSDEEFARMLQAEEEALMLQQYVATEDNSEIETRIRPYVSQVLMYEDPNRQDSARKTVPVERLEEKALVALAKEGNFKPTKSEQDHAFLLQLLFWFKQSFRWVNAPSCDGCGGETTSNGMGVALSSETLYGASRVELYRCNSCSTITRFPRYNDPLKLLETRRGRCGEWANCFTLYCQAFGYESRLVMDFTDHVWTECMSPVLGRWMHLDPCEGIYDNPLLYEKGWKKNLNYVIAFAKDGVYDVTKRYTRKWHEVLSRRNITTEPILSIILSNIRRECRQNFTSQVISSLEEQDRNEAEALERELHSKDDASISLPGRQSGDKEWRMSRSEFGSDEICFPSSSCCPARKCIDEHVTKIYNAFCPIISQFVEKSCSKSRAVEVLLFFKQMLIKLKNSPFRTRRTSINPVSNGAQHLFLQMLPSFGQLFDALSLKSELDASGRVDIYLAADPVRTSIALPVLFHALDDVVHNVNICNNFNKNSLSWPLQKLNRIYSGLVLASGEELPFGIDIAIRNLDYILTVSAHAIATASLDILANLEKSLDVRSSEPWSYHRLPTPTATFPAIINSEEEDSESEQLQTRDNHRKKTISKKERDHRLDCFLQPNNDADEFICKQVRALRKKLQQIEMLEEKQSKGHALDDQQIAKLHTRSALENSLAELGVPIETMQAKVSSVLLDGKGSKKGEVLKKQRRKSKQKGQVVVESADSGMGLEPHPIKDFLDVQIYQVKHEDEKAEVEGMAASQASEESPGCIKKGIEDTPKNKGSLPTASKKKKKKGGLSMFLSGALDDNPKKDSAPPPPPMPKSEGPAWGGAKIAKGSSSLREIQDEQSKTKGIQSAKSKGQRKRLLLINEQKGIIISNRNKLSVAKGSISCNKY